MKVQHPDIVPKSSAIQICVDNAISMDTFGSAYLQGVSRLSVIWARNYNAP